MLLPLVLWASFLLTDSVTLADSDIDRYRRLHNTPKNNAALSAMWSGEHSSRRPGILLGLTTPLQKKVACNMQEAAGSSQRTADSGRQWVNLWQCCKSKRVSGLSIMCNATAHKISVPDRSTRNYKIVRRQYPVGSPFALIRCRRPSDRPGDQADRLTDRANHEHLAKQSQQEDAAATRRGEAGKARRGDRDACGAIRSRCKPLIRSCRYLQILSSSQRRKLRL